MYRIWGYINVFGRKSKKIYDHKRLKYFYEQVQDGAFKKSIAENKNITLVLNHNESIVLASVSDGTLKLIEDSIGLKFEATIKDDYTIENIKSNKINSCSFSFISADHYIDGHFDNIPVRVLKNVDLIHVSLLKEPIKSTYSATVIHYDK